MAINPYFHQLLDEMGKLHDRKNHDYASDENPYSNFEEAALEAGCDVDTVFRVMIGVKTARLRELQRSAKTAIHESFEDSLMDHAMYAALRLSYRRWKEAQLAKEPAYGHGV